MPNGVSFELSAKVVAHRRAVQFMDKYALSYDVEYVRLFDEGMNDETTLLNFLRTMKWPTLAAYAQRIDMGEPPDYNRLISDATFSIRRTGESNDGK